MTRFPAGAQMLLVHLGRMLRRGFGVQVEFLLLGPGALLRDYEATAPTQVLADAGRLAAVLAAFVARGFTAAIVNTAAAGHAAVALEAVGIATTLLIHELPRLLAEKRLTDAAFAAMQAARRVVVPAAAVRDALAAAGAPGTDAWRVLPQGCYREVRHDPEARAAIRQRLRVPEHAVLMLGAGYADLRKGFDLFLQAWRAAQRGGDAAIFCWIGDFDPALRAYLDPEIAAAEATGLFHAPGHQPDATAWFAAADVFLLTSREDPYPTVVLEALSAGLPVIGFEGSGGIPELLAQTGGGVCVTMGDTDAMASAARRTAPVAGCDRSVIGEAFRRRFDFSDYAASVLAEARPELASVSVVVPSCDYAHYLAGRLASVFAQTCPVREVLLLDDASADNSVAVARAVAADWQREMDVVESSSRSGSPFGQWHRAASMARGTYLWIAEADDEADPSMLARLAEACASTPDIVLAACDSRSVDAAGAPIWPSYQDYYAQCGVTELERDCVLPAAMFARKILAERNLLLNVSAVLWRREALLAALDRCGADLASWRVAGDWRVYLEMLAGGDGHVAWVAEPLNIHRRHDRSASGMLKRRAHAAEIARMHKLLAARLDLPRDTVERQAEVVRLLRAQTPR